MRKLGWIAVFGLAGWALFAGWLASPTLKAPDLTPAELSELQSLPDEALPAWLSSYAARMSSSGGQAVQAFIVLALPTQPPPFVVASMIEAGDTQFPVPWPGVRAALANPRQQPFSMSDAYGERVYTHRLVPLDEAGHRCLLVNTSAEPADWFGVRGLCAFFALLLTIGLVTAPEPN
jgi:hypothetical protein